MKKIACLLLFAMLMQLCACKADWTEPTCETEPTWLTAPPLRIAAVNLSDEITPRDVSHKRPDETFAINAANLAVQLLQGAYEDGENCVISPYSVMTALAMTANAADGQTLAQLQDVLGLSVQECNEYLYDIKRQEKEAYSANSIWVHNDISVKQEYLRNLKSYYFADAYHTPFDDTTMQDMNEWVTTHTDGLCENALQQMHPNALLYLINTLSFSALWLERYDSESIREGVFYGAQGEETVEMMSSEESIYLHDETVRGFMKPYMDSPYSYVALLPNGDIDEYLQNLDAETLLRLIENAEDKTVFAQMPKHTITTSLELSEVLHNMGMDLAFSDSADFSKMTDTECKLSRVLHQTSLVVDGLGTQAGAVTMEEFVTKGVAIGESIVLDRPFLMGIYDKRSSCFLFLGIINSVN